MEVKFMPKIQETQNGMFVYLPKAYTTLLKWKKGDTLTIFPDSKTEGTLLMKKTIDANDQPKREMPKHTPNIDTGKLPYTQTKQTINPETFKKFSFIRQQ